LIRSSCIHTLLRQSRATHSFLNSTSCANSTGASSESPPRPLEGST
jgi:hypothetical protein